MIVFQAHASAVIALAFEPNGLVLATTANDSKPLRLWKTPGEKKPTMLWVPKALPRRCSLTFSPEGKRLCWGGSDLRIWDLVETPRLSFSVGANAWQCCFSPDGSELFASARDRLLRRWECCTWSELPCGWGGTRASTDHRRYHLGQIACHPYEPILATAMKRNCDLGWFTSLVLWDTTIGEERGELKSGLLRAPVTALSFCPAGKQLAGLFRARLLVWILDDSPPGVWYREPIERRCGSEDCTGLAFAPDGKRLVTVGGSLVRLWDTASWNEIGRFAWKIGQLTCVAVSPDGMRMAAGSHSGKVVVWDVD